MKKLIGSDLATVAAMVSALVLAACGTDPDDEEEHHEPHEIELVMGGAVLATYEVEETSWEVHIPLAVDAGEETGQIEVRFLDDEGDELHFEDEEEEVTLGVKVANEAIAEFVQSAPGAFTGKFRGKMEGETGVTIELLHGTHADVTTRPLQVKVNAAG